MATENIRTSDDGAVRAVTLDRPQKRNALTGAMYAELTRVLLDADSDPSVRVVLLRGAGDTFSAGNDLSDFMAGPTRAEDSAVLPFLLQLVEQAKPLVAAVDGHAVGIGTTLLLHADYVVASTRARFQVPFASLGLCPEGGSSVLLPLFIGHARASEWLMFGEPVDAASAKEAGIVNAVVSADELHTFAMARAQVLASKPPGSVLLTKRLLREPLRAQIRDAIQRESKHFFERLSSPEALESFKAFFAKRA